WVAAGAAAVVAMHCHVLGVILTPVIAGLLVADHRRRSRAGQSLAARRITRATAAWVGLALLSYVPLAIHELGSDASELRAAVGFVTAGGGGSDVALPARLAIVAVRVLGWPLGGLITAAPLAALLTAAFVVATVAWAGWLGRGAWDERVAVRWLGLGLVWTVMALAVAAPSLATVVPGLPNDHYHAFADPMVVALVAIGIAGVARSIPRRPLAGASAAGMLVVAVVVFNVANQPPVVAPDGGWRAAQAAAQRVVDGSGGGPVVLSSLPAFKSDEALRFPLESLSPGIVREATDPVRFVGRPPSLVVLCDQLFRAALGADCGGPAEDARARTLLATSALAAAPVDRFEAAPGRWVSVYRLSPGG
ncbi:MAG TPA: hypothetical protein VK194_02985, partial [Candidatus Deferrimicrobium sp.]|nr:hypothetical protein [Candidatus Deferrimicrobium sp.]